MDRCNYFGCCTKCLIFTDGWWKTIQCHLKICIQFPNLMTGVQNYYSDYCSLLYELLLYEFVYVCRVYVLNSRCMCWIAGVSVHLLSFLASWQIVMHFKFTFNNCLHTMHFMYKPTQLTTSNKTPTAHK